MRVSPVRLAGALLAVLAVVAVVLYLVPSGDFLLIPDPAHPVAPLVEVQGGHDPTGPGGIYFVDVFEKRATILEKLFPFIHPGSTLVPGDLIAPPGVSDKARRRVDLNQMVESQKIAAAVALRRLGYDVTARPSGVAVAEIVPETGAVGKLQPTDVIVGVDGKSVRTVADLRRALAPVRVGQVVKLAIRRGAQRLDVSVKTVGAPDDAKRAIVGIAPAQSATIRLPLRVRIDAGNVGGPSAGLAFALEVMEELGHDVDHGLRVAATGEMELDGRVTPIGGVKQKTIGARDAKADVFLVPAGENAQEARRYAHGLRIIPVKTFQQALQALATLPRKQ